MSQCFGTSLCNGDVGLCCGKTMMPEVKWKLGPRGTPKALVTKVFSAGKIHFVRCTVWLLLSQFSLS